MKTTSRYVKIRFNNPRKSQSLLLAVEFPEGVTNYAATELMYDLVHNDSYVKLGNIIVPCAFMMYMVVVSEGA